MPAGLGGDRLADVRVDLRQRVVAGDAAERVWQVRGDAGVVEGMPRLVHERLVVVEPALRPGDQVGDLRRGGRGPTGSRGAVRAGRRVAPGCAGRWRVATRRG